MTAKYGNRNVPKMYSQINALRAAIRSEGTPAIQDAWDKVEEHIDFAYRADTPLTPTPLDDSAGDTDGKAAAVEAERERCAGVLDAECARILSLQDGKIPGVDTHLRLIAVLLPDLAAAIRAQGGEA